MNPELQKVTEELTTKITKARLDAYERGLKDGSIAILDYLISDELGLIANGHGDKLLHELRDRFEKGTLEEAFPTPDPVVTAEDFPCAVCGKPDADWNENAEELRCPDHQ